MTFPQPDRSLAVKGIAGISCKTVEFKYPTQTYTCDMQDPKQQL